MNVWDSSSHFAAQTSAWCGSAAVSGSGFVTNIRARQSDPSLRRWQSMYNLAHESPTRWSPLSGAELRAGRAGRSFYQTEAEQWLQDAHERLSTELDWVRPRDTRLSYNTSRTRMPDVKQKQVLRPNWDLGKDAADLSLFDQSRERKELHEKVQKLESDLLQMRLDKGSNDSHSKTLSNTQEDFKKEMVEMRDPLREAEARATTREEERKKALEDLQTSEENQRMMRDQIEEMNKRLKKNSEVQEELREANNKLSQAYLDKAVLSTQVLKLEDDVKKIKIKLTEAQAANIHLIQEKDHLLLKVQNLEAQLVRTTENSQKTDPADSESRKQETELKEEDLKTFKELNKKLRNEAEVIKKSLDSSQRELQELKEERITNSKHVADLQAGRSQLIREKEELLSRINQVLTETKEKCCQHRTSADMLELEAQKLRDQCVSLEAQVQQKEEMLHLQDEEHRRQDEMRVWCIEELQAETSHWTEKWQNVALSLQATQNQLEELKDSSINKESDSELRNRRTQTVKDEGGELVQTVDKQTLTDSSESYLIHEHPSDPSECPQNKSPQLHQQEWLSSEIQRLRQELAEKVKEANERELALSRLERLRETEKTEAEMKISALEVQLLKKVPEDCGVDGGLLAEASGSLSTQLDDSRRTEDETIQEQTTRQHSYPDKDNKGSDEGKKDKLICPVDPEMELQRRMVTEQLKSLFKEREDKTPPTAAQDWTPTVFVRAGGDRRSWQQSSGLMPVFEEDEEDEEDCNSPGEEEEDATEDSQAEMSAMTAEVSSLRAENLLRALRSKQSIQDPQFAETVSDQSDSQRSTRPLYLDGVFLAEMIEICSPDEDEDEQRLLQLHVL